MARTADPNYPKGHSMPRASCPGEKLRGFGWKGLIMLRDGIGQGVMNRCVGQYLFFLSFNLLLLFFIIIIISSSTFIIFYFFSGIKLFLS